MISVLIILSIYLIRFVILRTFMGVDIVPQLYIAPRGLITVLLFYAIPSEAIIPSFEPGILLFVIIVTSLVMTFALIKDKKRTKTATLDLVEIEKSANTPLVEESVDNTVNESVDDIDEGAVDDTEELIN